MANRTCVRLGALTGADAALRNRIRGAFPRPKGGEPPPMAADALNENTL